LGVDRQRDGDDEQFASFGCDGEGFAVQRSQRQHGHPRGTNTLSSGEILVGNLTATNNETITGGCLTSGDTNADGTHDLVIINNDNLSTGTVAI